MQEPILHLLRTCRFLDNTLSAWVEFAFYCMNKSSATFARITSLDALRGLAALVVVFNHLQHSFLPHLFSGSEKNITGTWSMVPVSFLLNGGAAVALFFVLSGFVLTQRFFESGKILDIPDSILKRWPRLAGPVVIVSLISGAVMGFGLYRSYQLSVVNGSWWLARAFHWAPRGTGDVLNALKQGVWGTFFSGVCDYNGAFWTMHYELLGSIAVYALALVVIIASRKLDWRIILIGLITLWIREAIRFPFLGSFVLGAVLALIYTNARGLVWRNRISLFLGAILCVVIGGFTIPENDLPQKFYAFLGADSVEGRLCVVYFLYSLIALFFLSAALWAPGIRDFLSRPLLRKLGHLSFPIYLIHTPIMCSIGAWLYLAFYLHGIPLAVISASVVSLMLTILLAIPLAAFDDRWLVIVRRITPVKTIWRAWKKRPPAPKVCQRHTKSKDGKQPPLPLI